MSGQVLEISSLTDRDFIRLVAHYNTVTGNLKITDSSDLSARGFTPEQIQSMRGTFAEKFNPIVSCGLRFTKPFDELKFGPLGYVLTLYENYEHGCLPFFGPVSEQPAQIMEIFSVVRQLKHETELKLRETSKQNGR